MPRRKLKDLIVREVILDFTYDPHLDEIPRADTLADSVRDALEEHGVLHADVVRVTTRTKRVPVGEAQG